MGVGGTEQTDYQLQSTNGQSTNPPSLPIDQSTNPPSMPMHQCPMAAMANASSYQGQCTLVLWLGGSRGESRFGHFASYAP